LAEADRRVDRNITGFNAAVDSALHHYNPAYVEAAKTLEIRLKTRRGFNPRGAVISMIGLFPVPAFFFERFNKKIHTGMSG
jgi:hypothetical protein